MSNLYKLRKMGQPTAEIKANIVESNKFPVDDEKRFYQPRNEELTADFDEHMIEEYRPTNHEG